MPAIAALVARLSDRRTALVATLLAAASWTTLYHGIYARMYSLFLFTSVLSLLLLLRASERGSRGRWAAWAGGTLALLATQPYGVLVLAAEVVYVAALRARRPISLRGPLLALGAVLLLAARSGAYALLASRFDVGVGESSSELGSLDVLEYLWDVFGDFAAGWPAVDPAALLAVLGLVVLARTRPDAAVLTLAAAGVPVVALLAAGSGPGSLESRHLIFLLPFATMAIAAGLLFASARRWPGRARRGRSGPGLLPRRAGRLGPRPDPLALHGRAGTARRLAAKRPPGSRSPAARTTCSSVTSRRTSTRGSTARPTAGCSSRGPT